MKSFEKKYWSSGEFTKQNGGSYEGYVIIKDKKAYDFKTGEILVKNHNYLANFRTSPLFFDRLLDDELELPYNKHQITFAPNDFLNKTTVKSILKRLQLNNHYLFRCSTVSETSLPCTGGSEITVLSTYNNSSKLTPQSLEKQMEYLIETEIQGNSNGYSINNSNKILSDNTFFSNEFNTAKYDLCDLVNAEISVLERLITDDGVKVNLLLILTYKTKIAFVRFVYDVGKGEQDANECFLDFSDTAYNTIVLEYIDPHNKNSLRFMDLVDAKIQGNQMFVLDRKLNMLVKYDISSLVDASSFWNINQIRYISSLQGVGDASNKTYFNKPTALAISDRFVYVADNGNHCIKKYTTELDHKRTFKNGKFVSYEICSMSQCPYEFTLDDGTYVPSGSLWVVS